MTASGVFADRLEPGVQRAGVPRHRVVRQLEAGTGRSSAAAGGCGRPRSRLPPGGVPRPRRDRPAGRSAPRAPAPRRIDRRVRVRRAGTSSARTCSRATGARTRARSGTRRSSRRQGASAPQRPMAACARSTRRAAVRSQTRGRSSASTIAASAPRRAGVIRRPRSSRENPIAASTARQALTRTNARTKKRNTGPSWNISHGSDGTCDVAPGVVPEPPVAGLERDVRADVIRSAGDEADKDDPSREPSPLGEERPAPSGPERRRRRAAAACSRGRSTARRPVSRTGAAAPTADTLADNRVV